METGQRKRLGLAGVMLTDSHTAARLDGAAAKLISESERHSHAEFLALCLEPVDSVFIACSKGLARSSALRSA